MFFSSKAALSALVAVAAAVGTLASSNGALRIVNARASVASGSVSEGTFPYVDQ